MPAYKKDWEGFKQAGFSVATASGIGLVGKTVIDAKRPDGDGDDSFPSNHTANSFAAATTMYRRYGWQVGFPAYVAAALVGNGRVEARRHYWRDVAGGALLGISSAWYFTDPENDSVKFTPWAENNAAGVTYALKW